MSRTVTHLGAEAEQLGTGLRELRERTGLSLAALAGRTAYSKSSWERYLNGKKPVPRQAVVVLCTLAGEPPGRLLALWELADAAWSGRAVGSTAPGAGPAGTEAGGTGAGGTAGAGGADEPVSELVGPPEVPSADAPVAWWRRRRVTVVVGAAVALAVAGAVSVSLALSGGGHAGESRAGERPKGPAPAPYEPHCKGAACEGKDPAKMGCGFEAQVATLAVRRFDGGRRIDLRYNATCQALWARSLGLRHGERVTVSVPGAKGKEVRVVKEERGLRFLATPMTTVTGGPDGAKTTGAKVCWIPSGGGQRECFTK
ncbi:helix-turn-helix domain-containing protein [Actinomycetota bacterium Odt1-20B]